MERAGAKGVDFIVSLILARLLEPEAYGTIALITVFINVMSVFIDSGMANALIQKKDADQTDFSSVFVFNMTICLFLYAILFISAPFIAGFYSMPEMTVYVRILGLTIIISGIKNVQQAYITKNMLFRSFFQATLAGTIMAAIVGVFLAFRGFGVWALIAQSLLNNIIDTMVLWVAVKWRPTKDFSIERLKVLLSYGYKLFLANLISRIYEELRQLFIGKGYSTSDLAYYNRGFSFPRVLAMPINNAVNTVLFPTLSEKQDDTCRIKEMTKRVVQVSSYIMLPMMAGVAICADTFVSLVLTDKWLPCVFYIRVFAFSYAFIVIHTANNTVIRALGRSSIFLKMETIITFIDLVALLVTVPFGVKAIAIGYLFSNIIGEIIISIPNEQLISYSWIKQIKDMMPNIFLTAMMCLAVFFVKCIPADKLLSLILQITIGIIAYLALSHITHNRSYGYARLIFRYYLEKKRR